MDASHIHTCTWFYRPEHVTLTDVDEWEPRELFLCDEVESTDQSACTLELTPMTVSELHAVDALVDAPHTFFWRRHYELSTGTITPLPVAPAAGGSTPMETDAPQTPQTGSAGAAGATQPQPRVPRRNVANERITALEEQVHELQQQAKQIPTLLALVNALEARMEAAQGAAASP